MIGRLNSANFSFRASISDKDIDKYLDGNTYGRPVKIVLSDSISDKLDGQEIEIKHRGNKEKYQIVYDDKPFEIVLK